MIKSSWIGVIIVGALILLAMSVSLRLWSQQRPTPASAAFASMPETIVAPSATQAHDVGDGIMVSAAMGEAILYIDPKASRKDIAALRQRLEMMNAEAIGFIDKTHIMQVRSESHSAQQLVTELYGAPGVLYTNYNMMTNYATTPDQE